MYQKQTLNKVNKYDKFIFKLIDKQTNLNYKKFYKNREIKKNLELQMHHILPKHEGGKDEESNLVICTIYDHIEAHKIRFETYNNFYDKAAYLFLSSNDKKGRQAICQAIVEKNRKNGTGFFNRETQIELAKRPKKSYHLQDYPELAQQYAKKAKRVSKMTSEIARLNYYQRGNYVGNNFGSKGGIKHQDPITKKTLARTLFWKHDSGVIVKTTDIKTLAQVKAQLNLAVPKSVSYTSGLSEIIRQKTKKRYGWVLYKKN
jgi:hypothetical protein